MWKKYKNVWITFAFVFQHMKTNVMLNEHEFYVLWTHYGLLGWKPMCKYVTCHTIIMLEAKSLLVRLTWRGSWLKHRKVMYLQIHWTHNLTLEHVKINQIYLKKSLGTKCMKLASLSNPSSNLCLIVYNLETSYDKFILFTLSASKLFSI